MNPDPRPVPGDQELLAQRDFLRRLARGILGDDALAEDVVQEAELRALAREPGSAGGLRAWLVTVTRRLALNARRARERRAVRERIAARPEALPGPEDALAGIELQRAVLAAVRALDEPYRTVLWQRYYEDHAPRAIAVRLDLPVATVKTRLRRALDRLRATLDEEHAGRRDVWAGGLVALVGAPGVGTVAAGTLGGAVLMKKLTIAAGVVALAWFGWRVLGGESRSTESSEGALEAAELAQPRAERPVEATEVSANERIAAEPIRPQPEAGPASRAGTLQVHASWEGGGGDATGIGLTLWPAGDCLAELHARRAETDEHGRVTFEEVTAGSYQLHSDRDTETTLDLAETEERALELGLPAGLDVVGLVLDGERNPVAGAEVWLENNGPPSRTGSLGGRVVTRTGADGSFRLRGLGEQQALGAFAPGFAPAFLERLAGRECAPGDTAVRVTLVLDRPGSELRGRVLDPEGEPVHGARIALGRGGNAVTGGENGRSNWHARARILVSDVEGRFRASWLEEPTVKDPSLYPLFVLAEGYALAGTSDAEVRSALGSELVVRLERGARVEGRIVDEGGSGCAGAMVAVQPASTSEGSGPFPLPSTKSGAQGAYVLEHVPAGEVQLETWLESDRSRGAQARRVLADEALEHWDLTLSTARVIRGRVVDEQGRGLASRSVLVSSERGMTRVVSDAEGSFVFVPFGPGEEWTFALVGSSGVIDQRERVPVGAEVVLVAHVYEGRIQGGFTDHAGRAGEGEAVVASLERDSGVLMRSEAALDARGAFAFEGVAPGRYHVTILSGENTIARTPWFELFGDDAVALDWLESKAPGSIVVACSTPPCATLDAVHATLFDPVSEERIELGAREGTFVGAELMPGRYRLSVGGDGLALVQRELEIRAGEETLLALGLQPGIRWRLSFLPPAGLLVTNLHVVVREQTSGIVFEKQTQNAFPGHPLDVSFDLAPGRYTLEATTREGLGAQGAFDVAAQTSSGAALTFELR